MLPQDFLWHEYQGRFDDDKVVNECGKSDIWPVLAQSLSWGYGASGTHGFGAVLVKDRFHAGGRGQYFDSGFVGQYWAPFIRSGEYTPDRLRGENAADSLVDLGAGYLAASMDDRCPHRPCVSPCYMAYSWDERHTFPAEVRRRKKAVHTRTSNH